MAENASAERAVNSAATDARADSSSPRVTATGIARLAGVGRAAVSNWRRRHTDFPKPVGGTATSPAFALNEIEQWLRDQGKLAEVPLREQVWQQITGHPAGAQAALAQAGAVLLLVRDQPRTWKRLRGVTDGSELPGVLLPALEPVLTERLGGDHSVLGLTRAALAPSGPLLRATGDLAALDGAPEAYDFLLSRHLAANPRQYTPTPAAPAALMAELARTGGPLRTVLDPACGAGALLTAALQPPVPPPSLPPTSGAEPSTAEPSAAEPSSARLPAAESSAHRSVTLYGQEADAGLAALAALRLALAAPDARVRVRDADTLRADALSGVTADAVLVHPPFNERNWGHDELAYDPRWAYGLPARTESELAWVQHALARLREGGTAVLLMPPAAASRRSGRRIRADLLRRGALRAVIALPAGAAPPHGVPLHLWVLQKPGGSTPSTPHLLVVDTAGHDKSDWAAVRATALEAWRAFDHGDGIEELPGVRRSLAVIDLLGEEVDVTPARHLPPPAAADGPAALARVHARLADALASAVALTPHPGDASAAAPATPRPERRPMTTIGELARSGTLVLRSGGAGTAPPGHAPPVLTDHDVNGGDAPSGTLPEESPLEPAEEPVLLRADDVVVPVLGGASAVRVVDEATAGAALGRHLVLLRPDPATIDPWFLAGFLRGTANNRRASSYAYTSTRLDVRRIRLPMLPLTEQRAYGRRFRDLAAFEAALRTAARLGEHLVQGCYDGLADGSAGPH